MNNKLHSELIKKAMFPDLGCSEFRELTARKAGDAANLLI